MMFINKFPEERLLRWFTNFADADKYSEGLNYFENRECCVKQISSNRFEVYEIINL